MLVNFPMMARRWCFLFFLGVFGLLEVSPTLAQTNFPSQWDIPRREIEEVWNVRKEVLSLGQDALGETELKEILRLKTKYNLTTLPQVSLALLEEVKNSNGDPDTLQEERLSWAAKLSPNTSSWSYFHCSPSNLPKGWFASMVECAGGLKREWQQTPGKFRFLTNSFLISYWTFLLVASLFLAILFFRRIPSTCHLWAHRAKGFSPKSLFFFSLAGLTLSWLLVGPIGPALLSILLLWRYIDFSERLVIVILTLTAAMLPFALLAPALQFKYEQGIDQILADPLQDADLREKGLRLRAWIQEHPDDAEAIFTLGNIEKTVGRRKQAKALYAQAIALSPEWHKPLVNLANIQFQERRTSEAIRLLQKATTFSSDASGAFFNLGKIFISRADLEEGNKALRRSKEINPTEFARLDTVSKAENVSGILVDENISPDELRPRIWSLDSQVKSIRTSLFKNMFPNLSIPLFWGLLMGTLVIAFILGKLFPIRHIPRPCEKCGLPVCSICDPAVEHQAICTQCYHLFVRLEAVDSEVRKGKERAISRFRIRRDLQERWSSALFPGLHLLFQGRALAGFLLLFLVGHFFILGVFHKSLLVPIHTPAWMPSFPCVAISWTLLGLIYLLTLQRAVKH